MKILFLIACLIPTAFAQAPKSWHRIAGEQAKEHQKKVLGTWQSQDGTQEISVISYDQEPSIFELIGYKHIKHLGGIDPKKIPHETRSLEAPLLGLKFSFGLNQDGTRSERHWIRFESGGVLIVAKFPNDHSVSLKGWHFGEVAKDENGTLRRRFEEEALKIKKFMRNPVVHLDRLRPPVIPDGKGHKEPSLIVSIHNDGKFAINGEIQSEELLLAAMKKAAKSDPKTVLHIRGDSKADFSFARKVIKLGAQAGLTQVAFGALTKKKDSD